MGDATPPPHHPTPQCRSLCRRFGRGVPSPHTYVADLPLGVGWTDPLKHSPIDPTTYTRPTHLAVNSCMYRLLKCGITRPESWRSSRGDHWTCVG